MTSRMLSLDELCRLTGFSKRTVRYYIQLGLVSRPIGEARAAKYSREHLGQLLRIRELSTAGVSLECIREVLAGAEAPVPPRQRQPGDVEVRSHIHIAPGIELQIAPEEAGISPERLRLFIKEIMRVVDNMPDETGNTTHNE
ncbi:MerR family transcriptional regulator [Desulfobulbus oralis]|nr:MerR family transcriptional regulator [Desulfobulbus oralis]